MVSSTNQELIERKREGMELITLSLADGKVRMDRKEIQPPNRWFKPPAQAQVTQWTHSPFS